MSSRPNLIAKLLPSGLGKREVANCVKTLLAGTALLVSCQSVADKNQKFVDKYYAEDFSAFDNHIVFVRGVDNAGSLLIVYNSRPLDSLCRGTASDIVVRANRKSGRVGRVVPPPPELRCLAAVDTVAIKRVIARFLRYKVQSIRADGSGNVAIGFRAEGGGSVDLVRVAVADSMGPSFQEEFTLLRGPWYSRKE